MSQHQLSINNYYMMKDTPVSCELALGVKNLSNLHGASPGVGGATLLTSIVNDLKVVIKAFPVDCNIKYKRTIRVENTNVRDYGDFEIGTCQLFTELFILSSVTQNITTFFNKSICNPSYNVDVSLCTREKIQQKESYPIPSDGSNLPLSHFNTAYHSVVNNQLYSIPPRSDEVRFMMVELCSGDIQGFVENSNIDSNFDIVMSYILIMVMHTLLLFDSTLGGYSHNDLGTRNILLTHEIYHENLYWRYIFPDNYFVDIPTYIPIPKIWDFAFVRFGVADQYPNYYDYLNNQRTPNLQDMCNDCRVNDVYVLLSDIDVLLRRRNVTTSLFNNLDLEKIRIQHNNTAAIYEYFKQNPLPSRDPIDEELIIHQFPNDINLFNGLDLNRKLF